MKELSKCHYKNEHGWITKKNVSEENPARSPKIYIVMPLYTKLSGAQK